MRTSRRSLGSMSVLARRRRSRSLLVAAAAVAASITCMLKPASVPALPLPRLTLTLPTGDQFSNIGRHLVTLSPDGTHMVYAANRRLYLRALDKLKAEPIPGTERLLPGAFVSVIPPNSSLPGLPGRIRPGAMFASAGGTNASYAIMFPVDQGGSIFVRAVHPAFPGQDAYATVPAMTMGERFIIGNGPSTAEEKVCETRDC